MIKYAINIPLFWGYIKLLKGKKNDIELIYGAGHFL